MVLLATVSAPVAAAENPRFETTVSEPRLVPGAEQVLTVQLVNDAADVDDTVKTATNVEVVALAGTTPFEILSGPQRLGTMPDGVPTPVPIRLSVPVDAPAGQYDVPLRVTYEYDGDVRKTTTVTAQVTVPKHPVVEVQSVSSTVSLEERGSATVTLLNNGSATAYDTQLVVQSTNAALAIEGASSATQYIGTWKPNETRTFSIDVSAGPAATVREYAVTVTPTYEDDNGVQKSLPPVSFGITPGPRQTFALENVAVTAHSETTATLSGQITNTGDRPVENAVVSLSSSSAGVQVTEPTASAGSLAPGESAAVSFELRMAPDAVAGPRQFAAVVQYDRESGRTYQSDPIAVRQTVPAGQNVLTFEAVNNTFAIDESNQFTVRVTNTGEETLTDLHARLAVHPPYTSDTPTAYVATLEPGESALLRFEVTTPKDAVATSDALAVTVNATAPDNRAVRTGPTLVPIEIAAPESATGNLTNLIIGAVVVVLVLAGGWWWLNR